jgi:hypothetical protein
MLALILFAVVVAGAIAYAASKKNQNTTDVIETPVEVHPVVKQELPVVKEELPVVKEELPVKKELKIKEKPTLKAPAVKEKPKAGKKKAESKKQTK